jgi:hypothetical protein
MSLAPFAKSAHRAARWLTALVSYAEKTAPDIGLNLEAVVQESRKCGCALPELEGYWKEKALPPALVLIGSDHRLAERLARLLSLPLTFPELPTRTVIWELRGGSQDSFALHYGDSERHISQSALTSFLEKGVAAENIVRVCQTVRTEVPCKWRLVWIPSPQTFGDLWESATGIRILTRQHGAVLILEEVPAELLAAVRDLGQRRWEIRQGDIGNAEGMARLEAEIGALIETIPAQQTAREAASWQWLRERCRIILERRRGELQKVLAQQHGQMKRIDQFLSWFSQSGRDPPPATSKDCGHGEAGQGQGTEQQYVSSGDFFGDAALATGEFRPGPVSGVHRRTGRSRREVGHSQGQSSRESCFVDRGRHRRQARVCFSRARNSCQEERPRTPYQENHGPVPSSRGRAATRIGACSQSDFRYHRDQLVGVVFTISHGFEARSGEIH